MPRDQQHRLFVGIHNSVVAIDTRNGNELWRSRLGGGFVSILWDGAQLFASAKGQVFCLDPRDGAVLWNSPLKGLGMGIVTMASSRFAGADSQGTMAEVQHRADAARAGASAAT